MNKMTWRAIFLIALFTLVVELGKALDCSSNSLDGNYEPFPRDVSVSPPEFHTRMEISLSHRNETYFVDERFDAKKQRGAFTLIAYQYDWETYWNKLENEIDNLYTLDDCLSYNWTQQGFERYRCRFPPNESSLKLIGDACSATIVLDLVYKNETKNARYLGEKIVRNIPVKGWRICKKETAMDYWFSVRGWVHTCGDTPVPVVVEARPQNAAGLTGGIVHSYTFLDFYYNEPGFKVPREIWCWGAAHPPPLPKLPRRFDINLEYIDSEADRIWAVREYYNLEKQLYRKDSEYHPKGSSLTGMGTYIRNKNTKESIYYNRKTGRCQTQKLQNPYPVLKGSHRYMVYAPFGKVALFEDPDAKPLYQGRAVTRGINCDVWVQRRVNWPSGNVTEMIWSWYFTQADWQANYETQPVPVKLKIRGNITINATAHVEMETDINFYSFESRYPAVKAFDVSSLCSQEPSAATQKSALSSGAVAGVSIACVLLGLLLGAVIVYFVFKKVVLARMGPIPKQFK